MQFHCYYNVIIVNQLVVNQSSARIEMHVSINQELKIECENESDYSIIIIIIQLLLLFD